MPRIGMRGALGSRAARIAVWVVLTSLVFTLAASALPPGSGTSPAYAASSLQKARADLAKAKKELKALQAKLDKLAKQQSDAEDDLENTRIRIEKVEAEIAQSEGDLNEVRVRFEDRLADMYKNRGSDALNVLGILLSGDDTSINEVIERLSLVTRVARSDRELIDAVRTHLVKLSDLQAELAEQKAAEQAKTVKYEAARDKTLASLEGSKDEYNRLRKKVANLEAEARRQEEAARRAEEARRIAAANARNTTGTTTKKTTGTGGGTTTTPRPVVIADFVFPVDGPNSFSDTFGAPRSGGRTHKGCDIFTARNTPLVACVSGTISATHPSASGLGGVTVHLRKGNTTYYYAHLTSIADGIRAGVRVDAGQVIGYAGNTGNASGGAVHLHFEIRINGVAINPYPILKQYR